ncbi:efflux RND transporter periplasmic adaptor subunit [Prolixibacter sp. NT017]|uniref:efflux RND transporter periplasmic adaptor subunit n=1 Tax=Prolixibacter sp. NT017 TaxID=2652390 RepID=UPI00127476B0|nr:efflux RND transporter periplasmic adaptor subunit [Prolixibacter sp. NT017]GET25165.1 hemolysin D [Prolixibacter sp. NT017]
MKKKTIIIISAIAVIAIGGLLVSNVMKDKDKTIDFKTATADTGYLSNTVTATGTLQAIQTVEVGTQVSGRIKKLYVDFNSHVKKGEVLAKIDEEPLRLSLDQARATLDNAKAELKYQKANYERLKPLYEKQLISQTDYDQAVYNYEQAKANVISAQSGYDKSKTNLDYATIYSPIDGVVLNRAVDEGQTVAASFNTPTLFTIANDLTQMQVEANVDEADIGQVRDGQRVEFTVDAYPDMKFAGTVTEIRLEPVTTNNVVTFTVIISAPNPDKKLLPGMTASATIFVKESNDALKVPVQALLFKPDPKLMQAYMSQLPENDRPRKAAMAIEPNKGKTLSPSGEKQDENGQKEQHVWVKDGVMLHPVTVKTGINDGTDVQILSGLKKGEKVVLSMSEKKLADNSSEEARSPFMPTPPGRRNKNKK